MILTVTMAKGGSGKTATASILAQAAAISGARCLAVDADPQANFTYTLAAQQGPGTYNLITGKSAQILHTSQNIDVLPASWDLATIRSSRGSARRLQKGLEGLKNEYDYIIIDTPTAAGELQYNAIAAADALVIPMEADAYNLTALQQIADISKRIRPGIPAGIIFTRYEGRALLSRQIKETIINKAAAMGISFYGQVRKGIVVREAAGFQENLFEYAPKSNPARDYMAIWQELNNQLKEGAGNG